MGSYPERIVCLTEETTETLYLLGQGDRIVGVSGYTVRPPEARLKPKISAFINAKFDKIQALKPDLVLAFSDLQADLAAELVRRGIAVVTFNQRSVAEILQMIRMLGGLVGCQTEAEQLASRLAADLDRLRERASRFPARLRVFFEEWDEPLISGIRWVEELVEIAGGAPIFPELAAAALATRSASHLRVVVRKEDEEADDSGAAGLGRRQRRARRSHLRDQFYVYSAAGAGEPDRRRTSAACGAARRPRPPGLTTRPARPSSRRSVTPGTDRPSPQE